MREISKFEACLLAPGQTNYYVFRRGEAMFSLPESDEGALRTLGLYQPQRRLARMKRRALQAIIETSLHSRILTRGVPRENSAPPKWAFDYSPASVGIMKGSSDHLIPRAIASYRSSAGWEVAKLGLGVEARGMLRREATVLRAIGEKSSHAPVCLGLHERGEMTVMRTPYIEGVPHEAHDAAEALAILSQWAGEEEPRPLCEFEEWEAVRSVLELSETGRRALPLIAGRMLSPGISHGDFTSWNILRRRDGSLLVLDWEWGKLTGVPGLDLVHYFAQDLRLVHRLGSHAVIQGVLDELAQPVAREILRKGGWHGSPLEPILVYAAYKQGGHHQKHPELLEACLSQFVEQAWTSGTFAMASALPAEPVSPAPEKPTSEERRGCLRFSIVTPSFKQTSLLKCCAASVRDQAGDFELEHLIHDGGTGAEFEEWARSQRGADCVMEPDSGMYDAINKGFSRATGDVVAWLNCDEQYLPGALQYVARFFDEHPDVDILFGDVVLVDEVMTPLAYRRAVVPTSGHIRYSHLSTFSAATFVRRRVLDEGHYLQTRWKTIADAVWIDELLVAGYKAATLPLAISVFSMLGSNLGQSALLFEERKRWEQETAATDYLQKTRHVFRYRLERLLKGAYAIRKVQVSAYTPCNARRTLQERWVFGRWNVARDLAAHQRAHRDGALGNVVGKLRGRPWVLAQIIVVVLCSWYVDGLVAGDAIKGPSFLLLSLLYLSFRARVSDQIFAAAVYFVTAWYLLAERPFDVQVTRLATFSVGALLSIFWASSLRSVEAWIRSTLMLIRRLRQPIILTDRRGIITMVNHAAAGILRNNEAHFVGRKLLPMAVAGDGSIQGGIELFELDDVPDCLLELALEGSEGASVATARSFAVGKGRFRMFAFTLGSHGG
jgi:glycosyltransferase involved in cell wall biosynthesis/PAS domain-containing protein